MDKYMDKYDEAVAFLKLNPTMITRAWNYPGSAEGGCLFKHVGTGCLTQVRSISYSAHAWTDELTEAIKADNRIPDTPEGITIDSLPIFAEWQRKVDAVKAALDKGGK